MPIALASWATSCRRPSNREAAPEKVKAISNPNSAKTAVSIVPSAGAYSLRILRPPADADAPADFLEQEHAEKQPGGEQHGSERVDHHLLPHKHHVKGLMLDSLKIRAVQAV